MLAYYASRKDTLVSNIDNPCNGNHYTYSNGLYMESFRTISVGNKFLHDMAYYESYHNCHYNISSLSESNIGQGCARNNSNLLKKNVGW